MDDVAEATLEPHSTKRAKMDLKREENHGMKAIQVSTAYESEESDTDDEANDRSEGKSDDYESALCNDFSKMCFHDKKELSTEEKSGSNVLADVNQEPNVIDRDCNLRETNTDDDEQQCNNSDDGDSSCDSSVTLELSSDDEGERQNVCTDRGGGDADLNLDSDPRHNIIKVIVAPKKRERDPEAYKKWLKAKNEEMRKNREKEVLAKQELQQQKKREEEERKETNKKKIQEWMQRKKHDSRRSSTKPVDFKTLDSSSEHLNCDPDTKFKNWLLKVRKREEEKRLRDLTVKQLEQQIQQEKKKISEEIYQQWLKTAKHKPKPVPLNQGPHTLRGTVSKIFVNPEPWKDNRD